MTGDKRQFENESEPFEPIKLIRLNEWLGDVGSESEVD